MIRTAAVSWGYLAIVVTALVMASGAVVLVMVIWNRLEARHDWDE